MLGSDGSHAELIVADRETQLLAMDGHETFKQAVKRLAEASTAACEAAGVALGDLDLFVYHQANTRILAHARRSPRSSTRHASSTCIASVGNTSAASVPLTLEQARSEGRLSAGMRVLLAAAGSGFTWGASVVEWGLE